MTDQECCIACNCIPGIGYQTFKNLVAHFGSASRIPGHHAGEYMQIKGIGNKTAKLLEDSNFELVCEREISRASRLQVNIITIFDPEYPENLKAISSPPLALYVAGRIPDDLTRSLGIVGSRHISKFASEQTSRFAFEAAMNGFAVISGMAVGADKCAHRATLDAKGVTIGVIGAGLENFYPPEHRKLADEIVCAGGAVISELPMQFPVVPTGFPRRNRIIAGLSGGVLVTEAGIKSGSMITAYCAMEYGKPVFAIPGRIDAPNVAGCHKLIKNGANLVDSFQDIAKKFGISAKNTAADQKPAVIPHLSRLETDVCAAIKRGCNTVDRLVIDMGIPVGDISACLLMLEMRDIIASDGDFTYRVKI